MKIIELKLGVDVMKEIANIKLPILLSYKISKLLKETEKDYDFYNENFSKIIKDYCEFDENGNLIWANETSIKIQEGKEEECQKALGELENIEAETPNTFLTLDDLEKLNSYVELNSEQVKYILIFIKE
jgi:hypothetical protein